MRNYLNMPKLISSLALIILTCCCNAQGSWNIGYIHVDSITSQHIGQIVRIDFKSKNPWANADRQSSIRSYIDIEDTGIVIIDTTSFVLAERRKIYPDHGSYSDQYLECINCKRESFLVYDAKILSVEPNAIRFQINTEIREGNKVKHREVKLVHINRDKLDGLMFRQE